MLSKKDVRGHEIQLHISVFPGDQSLWKEDDSKNYFLEKNNVNQGEKINPIAGRNISQFGGVILSAVFFHCLEEDQKIN